MRKRLFILSLFLLYLLFSVYAARAIWTFKSKPDSSGEVALILGTAVIGDEPSVVYQARINHALDLYKSGRVHKLLFSGGKGNVKRLSEAEAGKLWIKHKSWGVFKYFFSFASR